MKFIRESLAEIEKYFGLWVVTKDDVYVDIWYLGKNGKIKLPKESILTIYTLDQASDGVIPYVCKSNVDLEFFYKERYDSSVNKRIIRAEKTALHSFQIASPKVLSLISSRDIKRV